MSRKYIDYNDVEEISKDYQKKINAIEKNINKMTILSSTDLKEFLNEVLPIEDNE